MLDYMCILMTYDIFKEITQQEKMFKQSIRPSVRHIPLKRKQNCDY